MSMQPAQPDPARPAAPTPRSLLSVFRLTSVASLVTVFLGVVTNKLLAGATGPSGVALVGLFRTLTNFAANLLSLETHTVVVQRLSTAPSPGHAEQVLRAAFRFFALQCLLLIAASLLLGRPVSGWLFGAARGAAHVTQVRVVLLLTTGMLGLRLVNAVLSGEAHLRAFTSVNVITSLLTALSVPLLLRLGDLGLSMVIGLSCLLGTLLGIALCLRGYHLRLRSIFFAPAEPGPAAGRLGLSFRDLPASPLLALRTALISGGPLLVQSLISRHYGVDALGLYNAASLMETTTILVVMSSLRSYYLPQLGKLPTHEDKRALLNRMLRMLLLIILSGAVALVFLAKVLLGLLFTSAFVGGADLCALFALSMVPQTYVWCLALFFLHQRADGLCLVLEGGWVCVFVAGAFVAARAGAPLIGVAWSYAGSFTLLALVYALVGRWRCPQGGGLLEPGNLLLGGGAMLWVLLAYGLVGRGLGPMLVFMLLTLLITYRLFTSWVRPPEIPPGGDGTGPT